MSWLREKFIEVNLKGNLEDGMKSKWVSFRKENIIFVEEKPDGEVRLILTDGSLHQVKVSYLKIIKMLDE